MSPATRLELAAFLMIASANGLSLSARELSGLTGLSKRAIERQLMYARGGLRGVVAKGWDGAAMRWQLRR